MAPQRDWTEKDYYSVLGVAKDASKDEIKRAYRKLAQKHHPDANPGDDAAETRFKEVSEAHAVLTNDEKRREYDQVRSFVEAGGERVYGFRPGGGGGVRVNIGDVFGTEGGAGSIFEDLFGFGSRGPRKGADREGRVALTFEEAMSGTTTQVAGARVRIPAGVQDGSRIRVARRGAPSSDGGEPGDLYVRVGVQPHAIFSAEAGGNLRVRLPVTFTEAALGAKVEVPTLDGSVTVKVPAGTSPGRVLRVRGRGGPRAGAAGSKGRGDLLVEVQVEVPKKLSRKEKDALEAFASLQKGNPRAHIEERLKQAHPASEAS